MSSVEPPVRWRTAGGRQLRPRWCCARRPRWCCCCRCSHSPAAARKSAGRSRFGSTLPAVAPAVQPCLGLRCRGSALLYQVIFQVGTVVCTAALAVAMLGERLERAGLRSLLCTGSFRRRRARPRGGGGGGGAVGARRRRRAHRRPDAFAEHGALAQRAARRAAPSCGRPSTCRRGAWCPPPRCSLRSTAAKSRAASSHRSPASARAACGASSARSPPPTPR